MYRDDSTVFPTPSYTKARSILVILLFCGALQGCLDNAADEEGFFCAVDDDCAGGLICDPDTSSCTRTQCFAPGDCSARSECAGRDGCGCVGGLCVPASCNVTGPGELACSAQGLVCHAVRRECVECGRTSDCPPDYFCEPDRGECRAVVLEACGNGVVDADNGEQCDQSDFAGLTCETLGFGPGTLHCNSKCILGTEGCQRAVCGDGVLNAGEQCDGERLGGRTCESEGLGGGTLRCDARCLLDASGCEHFDPGALCGNDNIESGEQCDDGNLDADDGCSPTCTLEDGWLCDHAGNRSTCFLAAPLCDDLVFAAPDGAVAVPDGDAVGVELILSPSTTVPMGATFEQAFLEVHADHPAPSELDVTLVFGSMGMPHELDGATFPWLTGDRPVLVPLMGVAGKPVPRMPITAQVTDDRPGNPGQIEGLRLKVCLRQ